MSYHVYMLASRKHGTLYLSVTNDLSRRVYQHKTKAFPGFTSRYGVDKLVWYESYDQIMDAIAREKALKKWRRSWKCALINAMNETSADLYETMNQ